MGKQVQNVVIGGAVITALVIGATKGVSLFKKGNAGTKLDIDFHHLDFKTSLADLAQLNPLIKLVPSIKISNPTDQQIVISKPYLKIFTVVNGKESGQLGHSVPENSNITIPVKGVVTPSFPIEVRALNFPGSFPEPIKYFFARLTTGMPSTRQLKIVYEFDSEGVTVDGSKLINI